MLKLLGLKRRSGKFVGLHNGQQITGLEIKVKLFFDSWSWKPVQGRVSSAVLWLCFWVRLGWIYGEYVENK
jgi:hypothetical protein